MRELHTWQPIARNLSSVPVQRRGCVSLREYTDVVLWTQGISASGLVTVRSFEIRTCFYGQIYSQLSSSQFRSVCKA